MEMKSVKVSAYLCGLMLALFVAQALGAGSSTSASSTLSSTPAPSTEMSTTKKSSAAPATTATTTPSATTLSPKDQCKQYNGSCDKCVSDAKCMYCYTDDSCQLYPAGDVLPPSTMCALDEARWGVCWLNFEALIISVSVIGGVIILTIVVCCIYCCCCRGKNKKKFEREDARYEQQKMERKTKQDERRSERKSRLDEIRRKYGLVKDEAPYQRFDA
ncbi:pituitary tumor-transforming gene 1 protein-interacting protein [Aplysia californica]|uniref:Pituitary tumor-transforming gene 1 protein-interacting protein n=1 Tax=Aplysia californica TaxID=6500 RepID=A0ABM0JAW3_APLCA|nr:pituitary tumor-transforming gene 1 protein-interacting protein [Aplysia californica]